MNVYYVLDLAAAAAAADLFNPQPYNLYYYPHFTSEETET